MSIEVDVAIIGAGVVGLAVAAELARQQKGVFVLEKNQTFGLETSSRNSEVIHAGIYYPEGSLKARFCIEGNPLLYEFCEKYGVDHRRLGKIIVATDDVEFEKLEELLELGHRNGVTDLRLISRNEVRHTEPNVKAVAAILSPSTGILDAYSLMRALYGLARERGTDFVFETEVVGLEKVGAGYEVEISDREGTSSIHADIVINSAGLNSDRVAGLAGIDLPQAGYQLHYCKGEYFSLNSPDMPPVNRLVYPLPEHAGKGIHVTPTMDGRMRLGPNTRYVDEIDYGVDETDREEFYQSVRKFLPGLRLEDLEPEMAGIRPKLQGPEDDFRDFVIAHEEHRGLPGLINMVGIESPGLTGAIAIGRYVAGMVREMKG
ncbi:MAG TPA: NAD(P)/FAD-dependent oxidoreductase [Dehalococcoidales bacterium]|nr:NAD(P)/FAD-dependent oxidoreductase [Dehalococcoidales bacterium]